MKVIRTKAQKEGLHVTYLRAQDRIGGESVREDVQRRLLNLATGRTGDLLGVLPYIPGMKVMVQENTDMSHSTVNGSEGTLLHVELRKDEHGHDIGVCAYVHVPKSGMNLEGLPRNVVPIYPVPKSYTYAVRKPDRTMGHVSISRLQLPIVPSYSYTDYKSQGRSLDRVVVDIAGCSKLQSLYVMLSRVRTMNGLALLRTCPKAKFDQLSLNHSHAARDELKRLDDLHARFMANYM
ncbi:hypothetical protein PENSPDRAFT_677021 [Peniophora sp. CONT]|nr:hypothetical protein PENSPDRAFT_677021 [Peniophora sp. CONT]